MGIRAPYARESCRFVFRLTVGILQCEKAHSERISEKNDRVAGNGRHARACRLVDGEIRVRE